MLAFDPERPCLVCLSQISEQFQLVHLHLVITSWYECWGDLDNSAIAAESKYIMCSFKTRMKEKRKDTHLKIGFILLVVLLLLDAEPPWAAAPFPEGLLEFISADFWNTSMVALAMFSKSE